jgi:Rab-like protein 2
MEDSLNTDLGVKDDDPDIKVILLGDSAVGKSKLMERFLEDDYQPRRVS